MEENKNNKKNGHNVYEWMDGLQKKKSNAPHDPNNLKKSAEK